MSDETIGDCLRWVEALIRHYKRNYEPRRALDGVLGEVKTCLAIESFPDYEGTRFKEATEDLIRSSTSVLRRKG